MLFYAETSSAPYHRLFRAAGFLLTGPAVPWEAKRGAPNSWV